MSKDFINLLTKRVKKTIEINSINKVDHKSLIPKKIKRTVANSSVPKKYEVRKVFFAFVTKLPEPPGETTIDGLVLRLVKNDNIKLPCMIIIYLEDIVPVYFQWYPSLDKNALTELSFPRQYEIITKWIKNEDQKNNDLNKIFRFWIHIIFKSVNKNDEYLVSSNTILKFSKKCEFSLEKKYN